MSAAAAWWSGRTQRERRVLRSIAVLVVALLALLVWVEGERTRVRLNAELPRLRASIAALERDAAEVQRLRAVPVAAAGARSPLATLATNGGGLPGAQIAILDDRRVKVTGGDVGFGPLLEWLRNAQATHGMRVESARLDALPTTGRVRAELVLTRT
jgi:type II secretory pathway component PulM